MPAQINIALTEDGKLEVATTQGIPTYIAYGMLVNAFVVLQDLFKQSEQRVQPPPPGFVLPPQL